MSNADKVAQQQIRMKGSFFIEGAAGRITAIHLFVGERLELLVSCVVSQQLFKSDIVR